MVIDNGLLFLLVLLTCVTVIVIAYMMRGDR